MAADTTPAPVEQGTAFPEGLPLVIDQLQRARLEWRAAHAQNVEQGVHFPSRQALERISRQLGTALFPLRLGPPEITAANENEYIAATLESTLAQLAAQIGLELRYREAGKNVGVIARVATGIVGTFAAALPAIRRALDADLEAAYASDPAARSVDEVLIAYPSFTAIIHYRMAHLLHRLGAPLVARQIAAVAHARTGIDIHPGAEIGGSFSIDHGTGVVIGETTIIGDRVRLYQGVTLGGDPVAATSPPGERRGRHPVIGDDVVIHANASIVGRVTIGAGSRIAGNVWLTRDVEPGCIVAPATAIITHASPPEDRYAWPRQTKP